MGYILMTALIVVGILLKNVVEAIEVLPENCNCRDWYGRCKLLGDTWTDDNTWSYKCTTADSSPAIVSGCQAEVGNKSKFIPINSNQTVDGFWYSCEMDEIHIKYSREPRCTINSTIHKHVGETFRDGTFEWLCLETGKWVTGCYYQNETNNSVLLKIGQVAFNGLIRHTCDRYKENPGRVQYHAEIRDDIPYKNPPNKGNNKNFPELIDKRLKNAVIEWTHENVHAFIAETSPNIKVRYLPASRNIQKPPIGRIQ